MQLTTLNIHPVKSTATRPVQQAEVGYAGLCGDREWMVVDADGCLVSARTLPSLLRIRSDSPATDPALRSALRLRADGAREVTFEEPVGNPIPVRVHRTKLLGVPVDEDADRWLRTVTGRDDLRLVWCHDPSARRLNSDWANPSDHTAFADSAPLTLISTASVFQLNEWLTRAALDQREPAPDPLPDNRFRANLIIDGAADAFVEDTWSGVRIGEVPFRVAARVDRCVMTTIDTETFEKGNEPIRTLARHRAWEGKTWFAVKLVPEGEGVVRIGDQLVPR